MTKYVAIRGQNQPQGGFPHLRESLEALDCLKYPCLVYVNAYMCGRRTEQHQSEKPILIKCYEKIIMLKRQNGLPTKLPKLHTPLPAT